MKTSQRTVGVLIATVVALGAIWWQASARESGGRALVIDGVHDDAPIVDAPIVDAPIVDERSATTLAGSRRVPAGEPLPAEDGAHSDRDRAIAIEGLLRCDVVDEHGAAVEGARVSLVDPASESAGGITDATGSCSLPLHDLDAPERLTVHVTGEGRTPARRTIPRWFSSVTIVLASEVEAFGRVEDSRTGAAVPGAIVKILRRSPEPEELVADGLGRFGPLPAPRGLAFGLLVRAEGYADEIQRCEIDANREGVAPEILVSLDKSLDVTLYVHDAETGRPVRAAGIAPFAFDMGRRWETDANGLALLPDRVAVGGRGGAVVEADGYCSVVVEITDELARAGPVEVPMVREIAVDVETVDSSGAAHGNVPLAVTFLKKQADEGHGYFLWSRESTPWPDHIRWRQTPNLRSIRSGDDGSTTIGNLPPGLYGLTIAAHDSEVDAVTVAGFTEPGSRKTVVLRP